MPKAALELGDRRWFIFFSVPVAAGLLFSDRPALWMWMGLQLHAR
jgi:hypothetical protein